MNSGLAEACNSGNLQLAQRLLDSGANPNQRDVLHGGTPLHNAVGQQNLEMARLLLRCGADANIATQNTSTTPLGYAAITGNLEMVLLLVAAGARLSDSEIATRLAAECEELGFSQIAALIANGNRLSTSGDIAPPPG